MNKVIQAFHDLFPTKVKRNARGWYTFDCPACGDRRGRGGFVDTDGGGFRYRCQNGGCRYEQRTGWEPDRPFLGRAQRLFEIMGGSIDDIPEEYTSIHRAKTFDMSEPESRRRWIDEMQADWLPEAHATKLWRPTDKVALEFPEVALPQGTLPLWHAKTADALDAQAYVFKRCRYFLERCHFAWSPKYKRHILIPFIEKGKIIGWTARKIDPGKEYAHIKCPDFPTDYMLNQQERFRYPIVLVMQGAFDALALRGLCTFGSVISDKQVNLLNQLKDSGREIVVVPDFKGDEWHDYLRTARENGWYVSAPERWGGSDIDSPEDYIKDPGDAINRFGLLYTLETVLLSKTIEYNTAETTLLMRSR